MVKSRKRFSEWEEDKTPFPFSCFGFEQSLYLSVSHFFKKGGKQIFIFGIFWGVG